MIGAKFKHKRNEKVIYTICSVGKERTSIEWIGTNSGKRETTSYPTRYVENFLKDGDWIIVGQTIEAEDL